MNTIFSSSSPINVKNVIETESWVEQRCLRRRELGHAEVGCAFAAESWVAEEWVAESWVTECWVAESWVEQRWVAPSPPRPGSPRAGSWVPEMGRRDFWARKRKRRTGRERETQRKMIRERNRGREEEEIVKSWERKCGRGWRFENREREREGDKPRRWRGVGVRGKMEKIGLGWFISFKLVLRV